MKRKSLRMLAAAFGTALVLTGVAPMSLQAASATVIDASNVRSEASSTSNAVGSAAAGATVTIGDAVTNDAGETWYPVTLSDGTKGYIKSNLLNITDGEQTDDAAAGDGAAESTGDSAAAGDSASAGDSAATGDSAAAGDSSADGASTADTSADVPTAQAEGYAAAMTPTNATISSDVNIRSGAGTSYTKIGSLTAGTNLVVIGQAKDDSGDIWYQFYTTGTDQQMIGFARYDYVTLGDPVQAAAPADTTTENSDADASSDASSGDKEYEAVYADDGTGSGTKVWYLYNYKTGTRKEITKMEDAITESNQVVTEAKASLHKMKLLILVLGVLLLACLAAIVALVLNLRRADAESGEIDLMKSRQRQERTRREGARAASEEAPHTARRLEERRLAARDGGGQAQDRTRPAAGRDVRTARPAAGRGTAEEPYPTRRRLDEEQRARGGQDMRQTRRPAVPERDAADVDADVRRAGEAGRSMRGDTRRRMQGSGAAAMDRDSDVQRGQAPQQRYASAPQRGAAPSGQDMSRRRPAQESAPAHGRAQADADAQNFADVEDDDDLQFLNMDN